MTKRRLPYSDLEHFTTEIVDVYRKARAVYDECDGDQTVALKACDSECTELDELLGRTNPHYVEIFTCIDIAEPPAWETRVADWHEAKAILSALERAAAAQHA